MVSAYLVPFEGVVLEGTRMVVFGRLWTGNGIDNDMGVVNGAARIERHLWSATASMKNRIIVSSSRIEENSGNVAGLVHVYVGQCVVVACAWLHRFYLISYG